jgi:hypothetical protein
VEKTLIFGYELSWFSIHLRIPIKKLVYLCDNTCQRENVAKQAKYSTNIRAWLLKIPTLYRVFDFKVPYSTTESLKRNFTSTVRIYFYCGLVPGTFTNYRDKERLIQCTLQFFCYAATSTVQNLFLENSCVKE